MTTESKISKSMSDLLLSQIQRLEKASAPARVLADCGCSKWRLRALSKQTWTLSDGKEYCLAPPPYMIVSGSADAPPTEFFLCPSGKNTPIVSVRYCGPHLAISMVRTSPLDGTDLWGEVIDICGRTPESLDVNILETLEGYTGLSVVSRPPGTIYERPPGGCDGEDPYLDKRSWKMSDGSRCFPWVAHGPVEGLLILHHGKVIINIRPSTNGDTRVTHTISFPSSSIPAFDEIRGVQNHDQLDRYLCLAIEHHLRLTIVSRPTDVPYRCPLHTKPVHELHTKPVQAPPLEPVQTKAPPPRRRTAARPLPLPPALDFGERHVDSEIMQEMRAAREKERQDALSASTRERKSYNCKVCNTRAPIDPDSDRVLASCGAGCELHFHMTCFKKNRVRLHDQCNCDRGGTVTAIHRWRAGRRVWSETVPVRQAPGTMAITPPLPEMSENPLQSVIVPLTATVPPRPVLPAPPAQATKPRYDRPVVPIHGSRKNPSETAAAAASRRRRRKRPPRVPVSGMNILDIQREFERLDVKI